MTAMELLSAAEGAAIHDSQVIPAVREAISEAVKIVLSDLHAMLFPEQHPFGTPFHDPEHVFWQGRDPGYQPEPGEVFEWDAETIEWVASWTDGLLKELG